MRPRILRFRCQAPISRLVDLPQRTSPTPEVWSGKMRRDRMSKTLALLAATAAVVSLSTRADAMRAITANDGMLWRCDQRFHAYGYNYGPQAWRWLCGCVPPARGGPIPSFRYFDHPTSRSLRWISKDFARARRHGANTIRIYIELRHVMRTPTRPRARTLRALAALLKSAERRGVFLDITGNLVWRREKSPSWYDRLSDHERWRVQGRFWRFVAAVAAPSPSVLAYELTSEPVIIQGADWYHGFLGGYWFVPSIAREVDPSEAKSAARSWIRHLTRSIRGVDRRHLIGLGMLPWVGDWPFGPRNVARFQMSCSCTSILRTVKSSERFPLSVSSPPPANQSSWARHIPTPGASRPTNSSSSRPPRTYRDTFRSSSTANRSMVCHVTIPMLTIGRHSGNSSA
jgi:hypothetical protein